MNNQIMLIGRLVSDPEINETENGKVTDIVLAIRRYFKNKEGIYETDFIPVRLYTGIAEKTCEYCSKGDLIAVKGRVERLSGEDLKIIADKVSFLASKPKGEEE